MLTKRLNQIVKIYLFFTFMLSAGQAGAQESLTLDECVSQAQSYSVNKKKAEYLKAIESLSVENVKKGYLPTLDLKGSASYQSDVFGLPLSIPGNELPEIPKDQYNFSLNLSQKIYDGGISGSQKSIAEAESMVQRNRVDVANYQLKEVITDLYFGLLLVDENLRLLNSALEEIDNQEKRIEAAFEAGMALQSDLNSIYVEKLKTKQEVKKLKNRKESLLNSLSLWMGISLENTTVFQLPETPKIKNQIDRPELKVYKAEKTNLDAQKELVKASSMPKVFGYASAGYANPNPLNFFEVEWSDYYMLGARLEWSFWKWNETRRKAEIIEARKSIIDAEQENYLKQIQQQQINLIAEIQNVEDALQTDREIHELQSSILEEAKLRFEEGTLSATDYLSELNENIRVSQEMALHELQLIKYRIDFNILTGN